MIRHIVLVRFRHDVTEAGIAEFWRDLHAIKPKVPGFRTVAAGRSESPEKIERGYVHGFVAEFEDWAALAAYQDHPDHKAFGARLVEHAVGGLDGILVFDLETPA
ncbi:Dabb family protein [Fulvimarina sp. MAC8]|uniref:Dabb family protein n=1 Tax=Fulvimarina sp. MAC8 TaxID=3162874 RepID=UPI0032EC3E75